MFTQWYLNLLYFARFIFVIKPPQFIQTYVRAVILTEVSMKFKYLKADFTLDRWYNDWFVNHNCLGSYSKFVISKTKTSCNTVFIENLFANKTQQCLILYLLHCTIFESFKFSDYLHWFNLMISYHCIRSIRIWSFAGPYFPAFKLNTPYLSIFSPNEGKCGKSVRIPRLFCRIFPHWDLVF